MVILQMQQEWKIFQDLLIKIFDLLINLFCNKKFIINSMIILTFLKIKSGQILYLFHNLLSTFSPYFKMLNCLYDEAYYQHHNLKGIQDQDLIIKIKLLDINFQESTKGSINPKEPLNIFLRFPNEYLGEIFLYKFGFLEV